MEQVTIAFFGERYAGTLVLGHAELKELEESVYLYAGVKNRLADAQSTIQKLMAEQDTLQFQLTTLKEQKKPDN